MFRHFSGRQNTAVIVENGKPRELTKDEAGKLWNQYGNLPGNVPPVPSASHLNPDVKKNLDTVNQVNRINQINKRQNNK